MASSLAEDLVCPICLALFQEPHMLGCGHNFCLACLQGAVPGGQEEGSCPECRSPFRLRELKRNRALGNVAGKVRRWGGEWAAPPAAGALWHFCEEHDEPLKLFCTQDQRPICVICRDTPRHRGHDFMPTRDAVQVAQGKLKAYLKPLEKFLENITKNETAQQKKIAALKDCTKDLLGHFSRGFEDLHWILHKKEEDLKWVVEKMEGDNMKDMEDSLTSLKEKASSRTETIAKVKAALEEVDHVVFLKDVKVLMEQVKEGHHGEVDDDEDKETSDEDEICIGFDDDDDEEEEEEEKVGEEENNDVGQVIPVSRALKEFKDLLDFEAWVEMLECKIPGRELVANKNQRSGTFIPAAVCPYVYLEDSDELYEAFS